jgi:hypothetical protein
LKIKLYWPKCNFINKNWNEEGIDSYWLECTLEEAEKNVFPHLSKIQIEESKRNWEPKEKGTKDIVIGMDQLCYLVSKDLKSIISFPWYYPYSGQWNAYCPFRRIDECNIFSLDELKLVKLIFQGEPVTE